MKHSRDQQIEYIAKQLRDLQYIYCDPDTKVGRLPLFYFCNNVSLQTGAYRSSAIIKIFAVHQQLVAKTNKFHGYPAGALALCAAAVSYFHDSDWLVPFTNTIHHLWFQQERTLKLWCSGDPPDKDSKTSFVRKPWAIRAATHFYTIRKLLERKWHEIGKAIASVVGTLNESAVENSELDDPEQVILSESEDKAATSI